MDAATSNEGKTVKSSGLGDGGGGTQGIRNRKKTMEIQEPAASSRNLDTGLKLVAEEEQYNNKWFLRSLPFILVALIACIIVHIGTKKVAPRLVVSIVFLLTTLVPYAHLMFSGSKSITFKARVVYGFLLVLTFIAIYVFNLVDSKLGAPFTGLVMLFTCVHGSLSTIPTSFHIYRVIYSETKQSSVDGGLDIEKGPASVHIHHSSSSPQSSAEREKKGYASQISELSDELVGKKQTERIGIDVKPAAEREKNTKEKEKVVFSADAVSCCYHRGYAPTVK